MDLQNSVMLTLGTLAPLELFNQFLKRFCGYDRENHRWCVMHSAINLCVVGLTARGTVALLRSDNYLERLVASPEAGFTIWSSIIVMSSHLYHLLRFSVTDRSLIAHHYIMMTVLTIPYFETGNQRFMLFTDYCLFFMCGLPGMIDYFCMHLCYTGRMERLTEKRINNFLNAYIRAPGIMYGVFVTYRMWANGEVPLMYAGPVILSSLWNAQFFANAVAYSYGYACGKLSCGAKTSTQSQERAIGEADGSVGALACTLSCKSGVRKTII